MKNKKQKIQWLPEPESHNYPAALSYLNLLCDKAATDKHVNKLFISSMSEFKAKDIFRASGLSLLGISNSHVSKNIKKIKKGIKMSPILLVRDKSNGKIIIADGYHRLCAVYVFDEDAIIPCKIV